MLEHVKNKTEEYCKIAIDNDPNSIKYAQYQTDEMAWKAIRHNINNIAHIKNQTEEMKKFVLDKDAGMVYHLNDKT